MRGKEQGPYNTETSERSQHGLGSEGIRKDRKRWIENDDEELGKKGENTNWATRDKGRKDLLL